MTVTLLSLSTGHYSLEFETSDVVSVKAAIVARFGQPVIEQQVISAQYHCGGSDFTFQNDWDDPCLISASTAGDEILKELYQALASDK